ncbi:MAG: N-acetyl-gamma-glutamyl-phosphate reductase [Spirochaetales bacterium]|nr:N-acetyl-gamma-glutamyl-phosphate reductase [Spirochaetales bacterium]
MKYTVFVDGHEGTTGLEILDRLNTHPSVELLMIDAEKRKDPNERKKYLNEAHLSFLCLPDDAARESVSLVINPESKIIDASTAHRIHPDWVYGMPELSLLQRSRLQSSKRTSVPGCHSSAFLLPLAPLVAANIVPADYPITAQSLTGYSGGGKKLIAEYEQTGNGTEYLKSPRPYALSLNHKHLPEMQHHAGLSGPPLFMPVLGNYYKGLAVAIPLFCGLLPNRTSAMDIHGFLSDFYHDAVFVDVMPFAGEGHLINNGFHVTGCINTNKAEIFVFGNDAQVLILTRIDNLGKGASGAAVQCMNIMFGIDETTGLIV